MKKSGSTPLRTPPRVLYLTDAFPARNNAGRGIGTMVIPASVKAPSKTSMRKNRIDVSAKMTSLISNGPCRAASSSCLRDHSHQTDVLPKMSSRTLESTKVTTLIPACDGHDFVGGESGACNSNELREPARRPCPVGLLDHNAAVGGAPEFHFAAGPDSQMVTDRLWNCDLPFARNGVGHDGSPEVLPV